MTSRHHKLFVALAMCVSSAVIAQEPPQVIRGAKTLGGPVTPVIISIDQSALRPSVNWQPGDPIREIPLKVGEKFDPPPQEPRPVDLDPLLQRQIDASNLGGDPGFGNILVNRDGTGFTGVNPSDTVGDIGNNFYVQVINGGGGVGGTQVLIIDKVDGMTVQQFNLPDLAAGSGTGCTNTSGDPIVNFDETVPNGAGQLPGRWVVSEFTNSSFCVYISQSDDPTSGQWFLYEFTSDTGGLPDYPKYGVWTDGYYIGANEGPRQYVLDRQNMILGQTARAPQVFATPGLPGLDVQHLMPVDWDGDIEPPAGAPALFVRHRDTELNGPAGLPAEDILELFEFSVDFDNPANSTFTGPMNITTAEFDSEFCNSVFAGCLTQPGGGSVPLFALYQPIMWRAQYRNFGSYESIVANMATDVTGTDIAGARWFEMRKNPGGSWSIFQEGTASEGDGVSRWMASAAQDESGNIAVGYNVVDGTSVFPGMRYNGRLAADPIGTLPQGEVSIVEGVAANGSSRYGDYSSLNVDPVDGCTFWYTAQYNDSAQWNTRIASFSFDACGEPGFVLTAANASQQVCRPGDLDDITVNVGSIAEFIDPVTLALDNAPTGVTATFTPNPVVPGNTTVAQVSVDGTTPVGMNLISVLGTATGATDRTLSILAEVFDAAPGAPTLTAPIDMAVNVEPSPMLTWTAAGQSASFMIEIATDAGFTNVVYTATETGTTHIVNASLAPETQHFWRVTPDNPCGVGVPSAAFSFTVRAIPPVLLVDDDDNTPDVQSFYADTLTALNIPFDVFDTNNSDNEPSAGQLAAYDAVVWFTGDEFGGVAGPGSNAETALGTYISSGGCLFLSAQDYFFDRGLTSFMTDFLGISAATSDNGDYTSVSGAGTVFGSIGTVTLNYGGAGVQDFSDTLTVGNNGELAFDGNNDNDAATNRADLRTAFLGFPFEAIDSAADREAVLQAFFDNSCDITELDPDIVFSDGFE